MTKFEVYKDKVGSTDLD